MAAKEPTVDWPPREPTAVQLAAARNIRAAFMRCDNYEEEVECLWQALADAEAAAAAKAVEPWELLLKHSRDGDPEHAGNGLTFCMTHEGDDFERPASVWVQDGSLSGEAATATEAARDLCIKLGLLPSEPAKGDSK